MIDEAFESQSNNLVSAVATAFRESDFGRFALNLESPHGWVHGVVGGGYNKQKWPYEGHFWPLEYSSYEPVFMLHHA
jgi:tyrosinase